MNKKTLSIIFILFIIFIISCTKQETKEPSITIEVAEPNAILTEKQSECNQLGENIIKECMNVNPNCFELKEQWDIKRCSE